MKSSIGHKLSKISTPNFQCNFWRYTKHITEFTQLLSTACCVYWLHSHATCSENEKSNASTK